MRLRIDIQRQKQADNDADNEDDAEPDGAGVVPGRLLDVRQAGGEDAEGCAQENVAWKERQELPSGPEREPAILEHTSDEEHGADCHDQSVCEHRQANRNGVQEMNQEPNHGFQLSMTRGEHRPK